METDLKKIAEIAKQKEDENWRFCTFLKGYDIGIKELDSIVHGFYDIVKKEIDCTKCANCCAQVNPTLSQSDIAKLSKGTGVPKQQFIEHYLKKDTDGEYLFKGGSCPFIQDNLCTLYDFRPEACQSFPHLHKEDFVFRSMQVVQNYSVCPIVFNVYELLKNELWEDFEDMIYEFDYY